MVVITALSCTVHILRVSILKITVIWVCNVFTGDDYRYVRLVRGLGAIYRVLTTFADEELPAAIKRRQQQQWRIPRGLRRPRAHTHVNGTCVATAGLSIICECLHCLRKSAVAYCIHYNIIQYKNTIHWVYAGRYFPCDPR